MCLGVKLRAKLLFSPKTIISTFPSIVLIPSPTTAASPPSRVPFDNPAVNNPPRLARSVAHLCCRTIWSSGCCGEGGWIRKLQRADLQHIHAELSRLNKANWAQILLQLKAEFASSTPERRPVAVCLQPTRTPAFKARQLHGSFPGCTCVNTMLSEYSRSVCIGAAVAVNR